MYDVIYVKWSDPGYVSQIYPVCVWPIEPYARLIRSRSECADLHFVGEFVELLLSQLTAASFTFQFIFLYALTPRNRYVLRHRFFKDNSTHCTDFRDSIRKDKSSHRVFIFVKSIHNNGITTASSLGRTFAHLCFTSRLTVSTYFWYLIRNFLDRYELLIFSWSPLHGTEKLQLHSPWSKCK